MTGKAELDAETDRLKHRLDTLLARSPTNPPNKTLLAHLANEPEHLLVPQDPRRPATNWRASRRSARRS